MVGSLVKMGIDLGIVVEEFGTGAGMIHKIKWLPDGRPDHVDHNWLDLKNTNHFKVLVKVGS